MKIHRTATFFEPVEALTVNADSVFEVEFTIYDDLGDAPEAGCSLQVLMTQEEGSGTSWTSEAVLIVDGIATIQFTEESTAEYGEYTCELYITDNEATPNIFMLGAMTLIIESN